jgi:hypothetical protein
LPCPRAFHCAVHRVLYRFVASVTARSLDVGRRAFSAKCCAAPHEISEPLGGRRCGKRPRSRGSRFTV